MAKSIKPGQSCETSGQYGIFGPRGGRRGSREVTMVEGKVAPPTPGKGEHYELVDKTKHVGR